MERCVEALRLRNEAAHALFAMLGQKALQHRVEIGAQDHGRGRMRRHFLLRHIDKDGTTFRHGPRRLKAAARYCETAVARLARIDRRKVLGPVDDEQPVADGALLLAHRQKRRRKAGHVRSWPPVSPPARKACRHGIDDPGAVRGAVHQRAVAEIGDDAA
jgi:hypothetical protein